MSIMSERDFAIREKNMALDERRRAFAERDMAMLQRDAALAERNSALEERDKALAALQFQETTSMNENNHDYSPSDGGVMSNQHLYHKQQMRLTPLLLDEYTNQREIPPNNPYHTAGGGGGGGGSCESRKVKQAKEETTPTPGGTTSTKKSQRKGKRQIEDSNCWKMEPDSVDTDDGDEEELDEDLEAWKESLGLNQINFDDETSSMPGPVCSCTGLPQPCYKWGNGGWQSSCCTNTMSMYPLPEMMSNKHPHARGVGGRKKKKKKKMSGNVFTKLLNRVAAEGRDLSIPLDLKDHWGAKHGTNRS